MQHHLRSHPIRSLFTAGILTFLSQIPAQAAVTLTIDTQAQTLTWSGTATTGSFVVPAFSDKPIRLGTGTWTGGFTVSDGDGSLGSNLTSGSVSGLSFFPQYDGIPVVHDVQSSIYTNLGIVSNMSEFPVSVSLAIAGDDQGYSYAGSPAQIISYLESLDGTLLYFQDHQGGSNIVNMGSAVGQIVVVPEPSAALFLLAAPLFLTTRRRRA